MSSVLQAKTFDIYASILHPRDEGSFVVIVSAFPTDPAHAPPLAHPYCTRSASTLDQAQEVRDDLVASVTSAVRQRGCQPGRIVFR